MGRLWPEQRVHEAMAEHTVRETWEAPARSHGWDIASLSPRGLQLCGQIWQEGWMRVGVENGLVSPVMVAFKEQRVDGWNH